MDRAMDRAMDKPGARLANYMAMRAQLTEILGYDFADDSLIIAALTHRSIAEDNSERLEFLGDRVLALFLTEILMWLYPNDREGELAKRLSKLADRRTIAQVAESIALHKFIFILNEAFSERSREKILADSLEAVIAALYLDGGADSARSFIRNHWIELCKAMVEAPIDAKSELQEWAARQKAEPPVYKLLERTGPEHAPLFSVCVSIEGHGKAIGRGTGRKAAEIDAATKLYAEIA